MGWRDTLGPASFRGVKFFVQSSELSGGQRAVVHEYPKRDTPFAEPMGLKARGFPVEGYVIGDDYMAARDALLTALEVSGPGELVHPRFGTRRCLAMNWRVRETEEDGRMSVFSIEFLETPAAPVQPASVVDASGLLRDSSSAARTGVASEFVSAYAPGSLVDSLVGATRSALTAIESAVGAASFGVQELAGVKQLISDLDPTTLIDDAAGLVDGLSAVFDAFPSRSALLPVYSFNPGVRPPATTSNRATEQANFDAIQRIVQRLVVVRCAELILDEAFASYDEAVAARNTITALLDDQAETAADDTFPFLSQLRADLIKAVPGADSDLPRLVAYTPQQTVPSIVLAYQLYGDLDLEPDLLARNHVDDPSAVPGGVALEVLARG